MWSEWLVDNNVSTNPSDRLAMQYPAGMSTMQVTQHESKLVQQQMPNSTVPQGCDTAGFFDCVARLAVTTLQVQVPTLAVTTLQHVITVCIACRMHTLAHPDTNQAVVAL